MCIQGLAAHSRPGHLQLQQCARCCPFLPPPALLRFSPSLMSSATFLRSPWLSLSRASYLQDRCGQAAFTHMLLLQLWHRDTGC